MCEPTPFGWSDINSNFGILDECGFPKGNYYQSRWTGKPVVHVFPHWNWPGKDGQAIQAWVYSNVASVDLIVITLKATSPGLAPAVLTLVSVPGNSSQPY